MNRRPRCRFRVPLLLLSSFPLLSPRSSPGAELKAQDLTLTMSSGAATQIRVSVPSDWESGAAGFTKRNEFGEAVSGIEFSVTCNGDCKAETLAANLDALVAGVAPGEAQPNVNTGNPELDAVRLNVEVLEQSELPDGKLIVVRVTKPAGLEGPYPERVLAVCGRIHPSRDRLVVAQGWVPATEANWQQAPALQACRSFTIQP